MNIKKRDSTKTELIYTNTYLAFCKIMSGELKNELISEFMRTNSSVDSTFDNDIEDNKPQSGNNSLACMRLFEGVCKMTKDIYEVGLKTILNQIRNTLLIEVTYGDFTYDFLKKTERDSTVIILTNLYKSEERQKENPLLPTLKGHTVKEIENTIYYQWYFDRFYYVINTYNAFCQYASYLHHDLNDSFNTILFKAIREEIEPKLPLDSTASSINGNFKYIIYGNVIIVYMFQPLFAPIRTKSEKRKIEDENEAGFQDLIDSYAFSDEGVFPCDIYISDYL